MLYVLLPPTWLREEIECKPFQYEGTIEQALEYNAEGFNVYYYPNYPSLPPAGWVKAHEVDTFEWVFVDMDLKDGVYASKEEFIALLLEDERLDPTKIVDSGGGVHAYWRVSDLDGMSFLRLARRLMRKFKTDDAVQQLKQLMRVPGTVNTKHKDDFKLCEQIYESSRVYTCEELDMLLSPISHEDEVYCKEHFEKAHDLQPMAKVSDKLPNAFGKLLRANNEVRDIWSGNVDDRSKGDYRLGHIMFASGFTKDEAMSVLVNTSKALSRAPVHRVNYASNIVDKIWTFEESDDKESLDLSSTVKEILSRHGDAIKGTRFPCYPFLDNTHHGFRLGHVIGLVAGSGVGKTAMALNMFMGFVESNPDYEHVFIPLEQPSHEIADRWKGLCGDKVHLHEKVHVISNYGEDGSFRHLSLDDIREYVLKLQKVKKIKIGCVVIDHIGALKRKGAKGENQDLMDICHAMKAFAVQTNTLLVMQSQAPREKAGIGDLELNKDAAYGTVYFESYCDYLITLWQPLKRVYGHEGCPTVMAFKFCKIRHKKQKLDVIQEDVPYRLYFDSDTERAREMTQDEEASFDFFNKKATNKRKQDRKTDLVEYTSIKFGSEVKSA